MLVGGEGIEIYKNQIGDDVIRTCDVPPAYVSGLTSALAVLTTRTGELEDELRSLRRWLVVSVIFTALAIFFIVARLQGW